MAAPHYPTTCDGWTNGDFELQFVDTCNLINATEDVLNNNPCNCYQFIYCYSHLVVPCTDPGQILNPCLQRCDQKATALRDCPQILDACNCRLDYPSDLNHCPVPPTTTTTTTTTTAATSSTTTFFSTSQEHTSSWFPTTPNPEEEEGNLLWLWILLAVIFISFLLLLLAFLWWRKRRWGRNPDRHHTPWHVSIIVFLCLPFTSFKSSLSREYQNRRDDGFSSDSSSRPSAPELTPKLRPRPSPAPSLDPTSSQRQRYRSKSLKYKNTNIFPVECLDIGSTLGKGAYGKVFKGRLRVGPNLKVEVAVKTSTRSSGADDMERERKVFAKLKSRHLNIVNLMGVCLPTEEDLHPMLLLELCEGNLEKLLHKNKERFIDYGNKEPKMLMDTGEFTSKRLLKYCYQISRGMEFLEQHKIVHGDLATRNILLSQKGTVAKVSDFGLSMSLYTSIEELKSGSSGLPVRWMAPEVLENRQVSKKSDTWSFGVLLWEVFSLGAVPYPEILQIDQQFIQDLSDGVRKLGKPLYKVPLVQKPLDKIRLMTLEVQELERPSFVELSPRMWQVLEDASRDDYTKLEKEYNNYIQLYTTSYEMLQGAERDHVKQNHLGASEGRSSRNQKGTENVRATDRQAGNATNRNSGIKRASDIGSSIHRGTVRKFSEVSKV